MAIEIIDYDELTDEFINEIINDKLFMFTTAYKTWGDKHIFCNKIKDPQLRFIMMKNILILKSYKALNISNL